MSNPIGSITPGSVQVIVTFDSNLFSYLQPKLTAQIYPGHVPQDVPQEVPAFAYFKISESPYYSLCGNGAGITTVVYQFDCYSQDYLEAGAMEQQLRFALHGYRGYMGSTWVSSCRLSSCNSQTEAPIKGNDAWTYHYAVEYSMMVNEAVPDYADHSQTIPCTSASILNLWDPSPFGILH